MHKYSHQHNEKPIINSDKKILIAFFLNLLFCIIEFIGGIFTGSIAILSDSIHDFGDSLSIGTSFLFERISRKKPNEKYTYGYYRYSVLGSVIQSVVLLFGSILVLYNAVNRLINPISIMYDGMIILAIVGCFVNFIAAFATHGAESLNQKSINLHMLEDVITWVIVLIGAAVMRFTKWDFIDSLLSIGLAIFIIISSLKSLKIVLDIFLEKTPRDIEVMEITEHLESIEGVDEIHHFHVWSMDGFRSSATLHVVTNEDFREIKEKIKKELAEHGISHSTIECERIGEVCEDPYCEISAREHKHHHHH